MKRYYFDQFDIYSFHAESVLAKISEFVVGESDGVVVLRVHELFLGQTRFLHVVQVEKHVLVVRVAHQEPVV